MSEWEAGAAIDGQNSNCPTLSHDVLWRTWRPLHHALAERGLVLLGVDGAGEHALRRREAQLGRQQLRVVGFLRGEAELTIMIM